MKLLKITFIALFSVLGFVLPAFADQELQTAQKEAFLAFDTNQDGAATANEMVDGLFAIFAASDSDQNGSVSLDEFKTISLGYAFVAEKTGKLAAYEASRVVIFNRWDKNADGKLTPPEMVGGSMLETLESAKFALSREDFFKTKYVMEMTDSLK